MVKKVGIVGMGLMGQAFISNMRKSQFIIQGFDVDPKRMDELQDQGGTPVNTPADAAKDVDCVIMSLPNSSIAREAAIGANGISHGVNTCLLYTSPSPRDRQKSRMPSSA